MHDIDITRSQIDQIIEGYQRLISDRVSAGWRPFLLTLMYRHLAGGPDAGATGRTASTGR